MGYLYDFLKLLSNNTLNNSKSKYKFILSIYSTSLTSCWVSLFSALIEQCFRDKSYINADCKLSNKEEMLITHISMDDSAWIAVLNAKGMNIMISLIILRGITLPLASLGDDLRLEAVLLSF